MVNCMASVSVCDLHLIWAVFPTTRGWGGGEEDKAVFLGKARHHSHWQQFVAATAQSRTVRPPTPPTCHPCPVTLVPTWTWCTDGAIGLLYHKMFMFAIKNVCCWCFSMFRWFLRVNLKKTHRVGFFVGFLRWVQPKKTHWVFLGWTH